MYRIGVSKIQYDKVQIFLHCRSHTLGDAKLRVDELCPVAALI